jgi:hypothetical protein
MSPPYPTKCGVNAAQLELNSYLRAVRRLADESAYAVEPARQQRLITALVNTILAV